MPVVMEGLIAVTAPPHKLWTRVESAALEKVGVVEIERYELVGGELVLKMGKRSRHMRAVMRMVSWLRRMYAEFHVAREPTIPVHPEDAPTSEPEPDAIVLSRSFLDINRLAAPGDLRLAAEVTATTLSFDLTVKARLSAREVIAEYWVVGLTGRQVMVHWQPEDGRYMDAVAYAKTESVATLVRVGDLF